MKEILRELDDTKLARDEIIAQSKDNEKKIQTLEAEVLHFSEVCGEAQREKAHAFNMAVEVLTVPMFACRSLLYRIGRGDRLSRREMRWPTRWSTAALES